MMITADPIKTLTLIKIYQQLTVFDLLSLSEVDVVEQIEHIINGKWSTLLAPFITLSGFYNFFRIALYVPSTKNTSILLCFLYTICSTYCLVHTNEYVVAIFWQQLKSNYWPSSWWMTFPDCCNIAAHLPAGMLMVWSPAPPLFNMSLCQIQNPHTGSTCSSWMNHCILYIEYKCIHSLVREGWVSGVTEPCKSKQLNHKIVSRL